MISLSNRAMSNVGKNEVLLSRCSIVIDRGKIYAQGTAKELIASTQNATNLEDVFISLTGKELRDAI